MSALSPTLDLFSSTPMHAASGVAVRKSGGSIDQVARQDGTIVHERVIAFLRVQHPIWTAKGVARRTGISPATVTKWLDRGSAPSGGHLWRLGVVYGIAFVAAVYVEVDGVEAAARAERLIILEAEIAALKAGASK